jgi:hypothetical protein
MREAMGPSEVSILDAALAGRFARVALDNVVREYPNKLDHLMMSQADVAGPAALHPVFYGSYDWHSSVHMHWTLVTLLISFPDLPEAAAIVARLDAHFTDERIAAELAYLDRPASASFERPYGWAWLLKLCAALHVLAEQDRRAIVWRDRMQPLADAFVRRTLDFLPRAVYPSRAGSHANSAFASLLMLDYAEKAGETDLLEALTAKALDWYDNDRDYPVAYETCSEDFLSNGLLEAALMRRVLLIDDGGAERAIADARFSQWWDGFVPDIARLAHWFTPIVPSDRSDARLAHIDGLNLARAWCWNALVDAMPEVLQTPVQLAVHAHRSESLPHAAEGHYVGTHWLASFALLALGV